MNMTAEQPPAIAPFAQRLHRLAPELSREISGLRTRDDGALVSWLDGLPGEHTRLNEAGGRIQQAHREAVQGLSPDQQDRLTRQVIHILAIPVWNELANLQDRAIILDATREEEHPGTLKRELRALIFSLHKAQEQMGEGMREEKPDRTAIALHFMQHIRARAARQVRGLPAYPEKGEEKR